MTVIVPSQPPRLTPSLARALLRIFQSSDDGHAPTGTLALVGSSDGAP